MIPVLENKTCPYCDSPKWVGNRYKYYACGTKRNSLFEKRTDECRRLESQKYVKQALSSVFQNEREAIKEVIRSLAIEVFQSNNPNKKDENAV